MKSRTYILALASMAVLVSGCANPDRKLNNTGTGAPAGGLIGNVADQQQAALLKAQAPATYVRVDQGAPLTVEDVKALVRAGVAEDMIINQIVGTQTVFHLSAEDIIGLRDAGVGDKVVNFMINTPSLAGILPGPAPQAMTYTQEPPPPPVVDTMVAAPGPGYVWVAGEWVLNHGGWVWMGDHWATPPNPHAVWISGSIWYDGQWWHNQPGHWQ
jgi:hypothetical protein